MTTVELARPTGLTHDELLVLAALESDVRESAAYGIRARFEDVSVRYARDRDWCDEFRAYAARIMGLPHGPRVDYWSSQHHLKPRVEYRDSDGIDCHGYDVDGWRDGYGPDGFNQEGRDAHGYDRDGLLADGRSQWRFDRNGFDREGFSEQGFNAIGYDREGFNAAGYNAERVDRNGFNRDGFDVNGFNRNGLDRNGYDRDGLDRFGLNPHRFNYMTGCDADGYDHQGYNPTTGDVRVAVR